MSELFDIPESKSPRLRWMEKHNISARQEPRGPGGPLIWFALNHQACARGDSEDEALASLAVKLGLKLWNEEGA